MRNSTGKLSSLMKRGKEIKKSKLKLPIAMLLCALLVAGGSLAYKAVALFGINITAPVAGENWSGTQDVTWDADCETADYVNIQYTTGGSFTTIATVACNPKLYEWNTESYPDNSNYQIRMYLDGDMSKNDISGVFTIDNTDPESLVSAFSETYQTTAIFNIVYIADDNLSGVAFVELYYKKDEAEFVKYGDTFTTSPISFNSANTGGDGVYEFYTVAVDSAGNIEEVPTAADASTVVDTILPTITDIISEKANGSYKVGEVIDIDVTFSEIVTSTGNVTITLETGSTNRTCTFSVTGLDTGTCDYTVQTGDTSADLNVLSVAGTIIDVAGNTMTDFTPTTNLADNKNIIIDTANPTVEITSSETGTATKENPIPLTITFDEEVVGFEVTDIVVGNGTADNFVLTANPIFTVDIVPTADGTITVNIKDGVATDLAGNENTEATQFFIIYDGTAPTFNVTDSAETVWVASDDVVFTVDHTVADAGDIEMHNYKFIDDAVICGGNVDFTTNVTSYTPAGDTITVNAEDKTDKYLCLVAMDLAGNFGYKSVGPIMIDTEAAIITIDEDVEGAYVQSDDVKFTVTYGASGAGTTEYVLTSGTCASGNFDNNAGTDYTSGAILTFADETNHDGKYVCLRARDGKGDQNGDGYDYEITGQLKIDRTDPVVAINSVISPTNQNTQLITGTYDEDHISTIYVNTVLADLDIDNTYSATVNLTEGDNLITVVATDVAENTGTNNDPVIINLDTIIPTITNLSPESGSITNDNTPEISATLDDNNSGIDENTIVITVDSNAVTGHTYSNGIVSYTSTTLGDDFHTITIDAKDDAGNPAAQVTTSFVVDTLKPAVSLIAPSLIQITDTNVGFGTFTVTVDYNETMDIALNPVITFNPEIESTLTLTPTILLVGVSWLDAYTHVATYDVNDAGVDVPSVGITVNGATDLAGNIQTSGSLESAFGIDTKNPTLSPVNIISSNTNTSLAKVGDTITLSFTADENIGTPTVTIAGHTITPAGFDKSWTATYTMTNSDSEGVVPFAINFVDIAGNTGVQVTSTTDGSSVTFDRTAPVITVDTLLTNDITPELTGTINDSSATISVTVGGSSYTTVNNGTTWAVDVITVLAQGTYDVIATATDPAGNVGHDTTNNELIIDTTAPELAVILPVPTPNNNPTPSYTFSSAEVGAITYAGDCDNGDITNAVVGNNTVIFSALADGTYSNCVITVTDATNNPSSITVNEFVIDAQVPTITNLIPIEGSYLSSSDIVISAILTDENSGIDGNEIVVKIDTIIIETGCSYNTTTGVITCNLTGLLDGSHTAIIDVDDNAGNSAVQASSTFIVDTIDPVITINPVTTPTNQNTQIISGTYIEENLNTIKVNGIDTLINTTNKTYSVEISLSAEGDNLITTTIIDLAGRTGNATTTIVLDTQVPETTDNVPTGWQNTDVAVTLTPTDATSGVENTYYCIAQTNTCDPTTVGTSVSVDIEGVNYVRYYSTDNAGNNEMVKSVTVLLDKTTPSTLDNTPADWQTAPFNIALAVADDYLSSIATYYTTDGANPTVDSDSGTTINITVDGIYTIKYFSIDEAGNTEAVKIAVNQAKLDTEAPEIIGTPDDITTEATSLDGAVVDYTNPTATDNLGGNVSVSCIPISGSTFQLGATTVTCSATDTAGNIATSSFTITVVDTTAPVIASHDNLTAEATSASGAIVTYTDPTATDLVDGTVAVSCIPVSGSTFSIGETTVTCSATDTAGNIATSSFTITVVDTTAPEIINETPGNGEVTSDTTPLISVDFIENGLGIDVDSVRIKVGYTDVTVFANITGEGLGYTPINQLYGINTVEVNANDLAGNSAVQYSWQFGVDPTQTTISMSSDKYSAYADGESEIKITALVLEEGDPVIGGEVSFTSTIGTLSSVTVTDAEGRATAILTSDTTGSTIVTASYDSPSGAITSQVYVNFYETPKTITVIASPNNVPADGLSESTITATVLDNGVALEGATVNFSTDLGTLSSISEVIDVNGEATVTLTSTDAGWANIEVSYDTGNGTINNWTYVEFTETEKTISVIASPNNVPADGTESIITATVLDDGNPLNNATVNFTTDFGTFNLGTLSFATATTDGNGQATVTLTSTDAGWANVEASYTGSGTVNNWTYVEFTEYTEPDTVPPTAMQYPIDGSVNVVIDVYPYITFSEAMNTDTLTYGNIELRKYSDGSVVSASINIGSDSQITIIPDSALDYETKYYFFIGTGVEDSAGNKFVGDTWYSDQKDAHEFTTIAEDESATTCVDLGGNQWKCYTPLNAGWNLISLPLIPNDNDIAVVLAGVTNINNINTVKYYDAATDTWSSYTPAGGALTTMEDGKGYWIFMNDDDVLTINGTEMPAGGETPASYQAVGNEWNLIGFKSVEDMTCSAYINSIENNDVVWAYKNGEYVLIHSSEVDNNMESGYGYWLYTYGSGYPIIPTN